MLGKILHKYKKDPRSKMIGDLFFFHDILRLFS